MLDPTKIIRAAIITARRLPDPRFSSRQEPRLDERVDVGFAAGGDVEPPAAAATAPAMPAPTEEETVNLAKQTLSASPRFGIRPARSAPSTSEQPGGYQFATLEHGKANTNTLRAAFNRALERHLSLPEGERIANSKAAARALQPYLGRNKDGSLPALLTQNEKLAKAQTGSGEEEPIRLDDGRGVETWGLSLTPDYKEGDFKFCANSASCRDKCIGQTSGQFSEKFTEAARKANKVPARDRGARRTQAMMRNPEAFAVRLWDEIESARRQAEFNGNHLGVRLNTLSDINPFIHEKLIKSQPDVSFYEYTKMNYQPLAENHHYTYSSTGVSQPDVDNPHQNWRKMRGKLDAGDNVAMVFSHKNKIPSFVHDQETGKRYRVVDGVSHDFRPLDIQPEGADGVIVGLVNKDKFGKQETAHKDSNGFMVAYDPKKNGDTVYIQKQPEKGK